MFSSVFFFFSPPLPKSNKREKTSVLDLLQRPEENPSLSSSSSSLCHCSHTFFSLFYLTSLKILYHPRRTSNACLLLTNVLGERGTVGGWLGSPMNAHGTWKRAWLVTRRIARRMRKKKTKEMHECPKLAVSSCLEKRNERKNETKKEKEIDSNRIKKTDIVETRFELSAENTV